MSLTQSKVLARLGTVTIRKVARKWSCWAWCATVVVMVMILTVDYLYLHHVAVTPNRANLTIASTCADVVEKYVAETAANLREELNKHKGQPKHLWDIPRNRLQGLLHGIKIDELLKTPLLSPDVAFLEGYKSPCWVEELSPKFLRSYKSHPHLNWGVPSIVGMAHVLTERFKEDYRNDSGSSWQVKCLPYMYFIGAEKSGTRHLFRSLTFHPQIAKGWIKEPKYWNWLRYPGESFLPDGTALRHMEFSQFVTEFDYAAHVINSTANHDVAIMEGSKYLFWNDIGWERHPGNANLDTPKFSTIQTLRALQPDAKILLMLKDPVFKLYSEFHRDIGVNHWNNETHAQYFHRVVVEALTRYASCFRQRGVRACAYNNTLYYETFPLTTPSALYSVFLSDWLAAFPRRNFKFIIAEDYFKHQVKTLNDICDFLGVSHLPATIFDQLAIHRERHPGKAYNVPMLEETRTELAAFYKPFMQLLQQQTGMVFPWAI